MQKIFSLKFPSISFIIQLATEIISNTIKNLLDLNSNIFANRAS